MVNYETQFLIIYAIKKYIFMRFYTIIDLPLMLIILLYSCAKYMVEFMKLC